MTLKVKEQKKMCRQKSRKIRKSRNRISDLNDHRCALKVKIHLTSFTSVANLNHSNDLYVCTYVSSEFSNFLKPYMIQMSFRSKKVDITGS